ncbi:rhomboid family intramembrane serine protease [Salinigranum halophilum]|uniref:rhomboid family intramembrane serine protease n=1 Tax=Salinigranum halophilum TaxID=2565931 RepID=UPI00115CCEC0|nr:rhomboid family intramembrane serine protease [Salinigranum halophilum]
MRSPTLDLLALFSVVFVLETLGGFVGVGSAWFALAAPLSRPWTLVTSVYAHANLAHLLANSVALIFIGFALEQFTTRIRLHLFVLVTGALSGLAELLVGGLFGQSVAVLGASGAILALYGYAIAGNRLTGGVLDRLDLAPRATLALVVGVALVVTLVTASAGVALVAHFTGVVLGVVAGRLGVLRP